MLGCVEKQLEKGSWYEKREKSLRYKHLPSSDLVKHVIKF